MFLFDCAQQHTAGRIIVHNPPQGHGISPDSAFWDQTTQDMPRKISARIRKPGWPSMETNPDSLITEKVDLELFGEHTSTY